MNTEQYAAERHIVACLRANTELMMAVEGRIYKRSAKTPSALPCIVLQYYSGTDELTGDGQRYYTECSYIVKAVCRVPGLVADQADTLAALIDVALTNRVAGSIWICRREAPFDNEYVIGDISYEERGGIYRLAVLH